MTDQIRENIADGKYVWTLPYPDQSKYSDITEWRKARNEWRAECDRLERQVFEEDLAAAYILLNHPKRKKIFDMAWERGHSYGLAEVLREYEDLVELVK